MVTFLPHGYLHDKTLARALGLLAAAAGVHRLEPELAPLDLALGRPRQRPPRLLQPLGHVGIVGKRALIVLTCGGGGGDGGPLFKEHLEGVLARRLLLRIDL